MQINNLYQNQSKPNFKQINRVKISKEILPKNFPTEKVELYMSGIFDLLAGEKKGPIKQSFLSLMGLKDKAFKYVAFLEFPGYSLILEKLKETGNSYNWFKQNSGIDFPNPIDDNFYTFLLLTKKDKKEFYEALSYKKIQNFIEILKKDTAQKLEQDQYIPDTFATSYAINWLKNIVDKIIGDKKIIDCTINVDDITFKTIPALRKKLDF